MAEAFSLRDAQRGDEAAIQDLVQRVLAEFGLEFDLDGQDRDLVDISASYDDSGGCFRVMVENGRIVGCAGLCHLDDETGELRKMYVQPESRGRGWGRMLLGRLLDEARRRGMTRITLESHSSLVAARTLYESVGFKFIRHERPTPRADIAMELLL
jgi:putative acetyltransferase